MRGRYVTRSVLGFTEILLIGIVVAVLSLATWGSVVLARWKGRDPWTWAILTLAFLPALLLLALLPARKARSTSAA